MKIAQALPRLIPTKELAEVKAGIKSGDINIVVGTHALLGKSIEFADLGLLIVDEEQHFGVQHKERLKQLRQDVHVLTLTATPIPRTLQLALSGVREMSVIATPPLDRLAVRTYGPRSGHGRQAGRPGDGEGVSGTWKDLTDSVNFMASNLTAQVRNIADVTTAVANGRPVEEDHGRREGRNSRAEEHHQHDGGSAAARSRRK